MQISRSFPTSVIGRGFKQNSRFSLTPVALILLISPAGLVHAGTIVTGPQGAGWTPYLPSSQAFAAITATNQRYGHDTLEMRRAASADGPAWFHEPHSGPLGVWGDLTSFSAHFYSSAPGVTPGFALRVYPYGDPRSFWVAYRPVAVGGQWEATGNMLTLALLLGKAEGPLPPPASLGEIPPDAPVHGIHLWAPWQPIDWTGFYDEVRLQFGRSGGADEPVIVPEPAASLLLLFGLGLLASASRFCPRRGR